MIPCEFQSTCRHRFIPSARRVPHCFPLQLYAGNIRNYLFARLQLFIQSKAYCYFNFTNADRIGDLPNILLSWLVLSWSCKISNPTWQSDVGQLKLNHFPRAPIWPYRILSYFHFFNLNVFHWNEASWLWFHRKISSSYCFFARPGKMWH